MNKHTFFFEHGYQVFTEVINPNVLSEVREFLESQVALPLERACEEISCPNVDELVASVGRKINLDQGWIDSLTKETRDCLSGIPEWPGETKAVDEFLSDKSDLRLHKFSWTNTPAAYLIKP